MKRKLLTFLMVILTTATFSNDPNPATATAPTLNQQYMNLKSDLEIIGGYRMIKMYTMDKFWTVVNDTVKAQRAKLSESVNVIAKQRQDISELQLSINKATKEQEDLSARVDNMVVFGNLYSKAGIITTAILTIVTLLVVCGVLFSIGRVSYFTTRELRKLNENLYQEFDTYKRNSVEKEIKLSRELQNYRNRIEELKPV